MTFPDVRWSSAHHYDHAMALLQQADQASTQTPGDDQAGNPQRLEAIVHMLGGLLRSQLGF